MERGICKYAISYPDCLLTIGTSFRTEVMGLLCNLKAEMARRSISSIDISRIINKTDRSVREKISGRSQFSVPEATAIRDKFFPGFSLEYLFIQDVADSQDSV